MSFFYKPTTTAPPASALARVFPASPGSLGCEESRFCSCGGGIREEPLICSCEIPLEKQANRAAKGSKDDQQNQGQVMSRLILGSEEVRTHDISQLRKHVDQRGRNGFLLRSLIEYRCCPAVDQAVRREGTHHVPERCRITGGTVHSGDGYDESRDGKTHWDCNVQGPLVPSIAGPRDEEGCRCTDQVRWRREHERDDVVAEVETLDDGWVEVVEPVGSVVRDEHKAEGPGPVVRQCELESEPQ